MPDFKIIALRLLNGCHKRYRKVLKENTFYYFYSNYHIDKNSITCSFSNAEGLYNTNGKSINISAIVGKNGSGKSSIAELLYLALYNAGVIVKSLPELNDDEEPIEYNDGINAEIYYKIDVTYFKLSVAKNRNIKIFRATRDGTFNKGATLKEKKQLADLFYTLALNYSLHALNSHHLGDWIKNIFHKNDGYQTPIVLNPFRNEGIININNEEYLTRSRLIANLLTNYKSVRQLTPFKIAEGIKFTFNEEKTKFREEYEEIGELLQEEHREEILESISEVFNISWRKMQNTDDYLIEGAENYLIKKCYSIQKLYLPYQRQHLNFLEFDFSNDPPSFNSRKFRSFLRELRKDDSHITFKFRQALNFIRNVKFYRKNLNRYIPIDELSRIFKRKFRNRGQAIEMVPPSFFNFDIHFQRGGYFSDLSSGEKQKIFSNSTLVYHLINIDSVRIGRGYTRYKHVNVIFDEIELYYHPEMQRGFVKDFIDIISRLLLRNIKSINCMFITHSPYILSDIPHNNVLFLNDDGTPRSPVDGKIKTFAANIHDLLKHSFFLEKGAIGAFAFEKINDTINSLRVKQLKNKLAKTRNENERSQLVNEINQIQVQQKNLDKNKEIIDLIDEPILKNKLEEMYNEIVAKDYRIELLTKQRRSIETQIAELTSRKNAKSSKTKSKRSR
jgi:hypothetical protein